MRRSLFKGRAAEFQEESWDKTRLKWNKNKEMNLSTLMRQCANLPNLTISPMDILARHAAIYIFQFIMHFRPVDILVRHEAV